MTNDNIAMGIMTSYKLRDRYISCKNTWAKDFNNVFFFGGDVQDDNLIRFAGVGEDHGSCFLKQQLGLKYMFEKNNEFDWYNVVGCDTVVFKKNVMNTLQNFNRNEDFLFSEVYRTMNVNNTETKIFAGGSGFFISNSLMKKIYPFIDEFNIFWPSISQPTIPNSTVSIGWSDVAISYMIKKYFDLEPTFMPGMFSQHPNHYIRSNNFNGTNSMENLKTPLSYHYINPNEMQQIFNAYGK